MINLIMNLIMIIAIGTYVIAMQIQADNLKHKIRMLTIEKDGEISLLKIDIKYLNKDIELLSKLK